MASTLRRLQEVAAQRKVQQNLLDQATREVRTAALAADDAGVSTRRVCEVGEISPDTLNRWKRQAKEEQRLAEAKQADSDPGPEADTPR